MYDLETSSPCVPSHCRLPNEWLRLRRNEPLAQWLSRPSKPGKDYIKHPRAVGRSGRRGYRQAAIEVLPAGASVPLVLTVRSLASEESIEEQFAQLVAAWREAIENVSSLTQILSHPAYQRVIDLGKGGEPVVPLILRDLFNHRGYWATALQAITGENPVAAKHIGNPAAVREDWLEWGRRRGYSLDT